MPPMPDVVVVGAGVMGCLSALRLAEAGLDVLVLERSVPGAEASTAAAGILGPAFEAHDDDPALLTLGIRSRELHATLADQLRADHGLDVGFHRCGLMRVATETDAASLAQHRDHIHAVAQSELIDGDEARRREPALGPSFVAALDLPEESQLDPKRFLPAVAIAAERAGVTFRSGAVVQRVLVRNGRAHGVEVGGETISSRHVVVAAGSWTHLVPGLDVDAAGIHPVRGQILKTTSRPPLFRRIVFGAGGYVVTRPGGDVLCGSTEERVGFRREVTLGGTRTIIDMATTLAPSLTHAPVLQQWSSFRPGTADGRPLVGATHHEGLWLASGHFRNGILLAPMTAQLLTQGITEGAMPNDAAPMDPRRFSNGGAL